MHKNTFAYLQHKMYCIRLFGGYFGFLVFILIGYSKEFLPKMLTNRPASPHRIKRWHKKQKSDRQAEWCTLAFCLTKQFSLSHKMIIYRKSSKLSLYTKLQSFLPWISLPCHLQLSSKNFPQGQSLWWESMEKQDENIIQSHKFSKRLTGALWNFQTWGCLNRLELSQFMKTG